jgi:ketosteroid isomerase-like protein
MKKIAILNFIILAFALAAFGQTNKIIVKGKTTTVTPDKTTTVTTEKTTTTASAKSAPGEKGVRDAFDRLVDGIKQVDAEKVMSVYQNSDKILFFNNNGTATIGWDTMKKNRESLYEKTKNVTLDITGLHVEMLSADSAYATCKWKQTQEYNGKLENASGRMTLVFRRVGKDWKIVHLHTSPDNPDATRPVFPSERDSQ